MFVSYPEMLKYPRVGKSVLRRVPGEHGDMHYCPYDDRFFNPRVEWCPCCELPPETPDREVSAPVQPYDDFYDMDLEHDRQDDIATGGSRWLRAELESRWRQESKADRGYE
jgi:hypothetical protein